MFAASAMDHGWPIASRSVSGTWAWATPIAQPIGMPEESQGDERPAVRAEAAEERHEGGHDDASQPTAKTWNGSPANGRMRIARSGG